MTALHLAAAAADAIADTITKLLSLAFQEKGVSFRMPSKVLGRSARANHDRYIV